MFGPNHQPFSAGHAAHFLGDGLLPNYQPRPRNEALPAVAGAVLALAIVLAIWTRIIAGKRDHARIRKELQTHGYEVVSIELVTGGAQNLRRYEVIYRRPGGPSDKAHCQTNYWSDISWEQNTPPAPPLPPSPAGQTP